MRFSTTGSWPLPASAENSLGHPLPGMFVFVSRVISKRLVDSSSRTWQPMSCCLTIRFRRAISPPCWGQGIFECRYLCNAPLPGLMLTQTAGHSSSKESGIFPSMRDSYPRFVALIGHGASGSLVELTDGLLGFPSPPASHEQPTLV